MKKFKRLFLPIAKSIHFSLGSFIMENMTLDELMAETTKCCHICNTPLSEEIKYTCPNENTDLHKFLTGGDY